MKILEDNKTRAVLTTKSVVESKTLITHVGYDEDGDWQFFDDSDFSESDILLVSLGQMLELDKTLADLPNMRKKEAVVRGNKNEKWRKS